MNNPNGPEPQPKIGDLLPNGLIKCGCANGTQVWPLTDGSNGQTLLQCAGCKRNIGWARIGKREPLIQVPKGRM